MRSDLNDAGCFVCDEVAPLSWTRLSVDGMQPPAHVQQGHRNVAIAYGAAG